MKGWFPGERQWQDTLDSDEFFLGETDWIPASVPGDVHTALLEHGIITNPYESLNSRDCEWVSHRDWSYLTSFRVPQEWHGKTILLTLGGIDYSGSIYVNGTLCGKHESMFVPLELDITDLVRWDSDNELEVVLDHIPFEQCQYGDSSLVRTQKSRFAYKWDFCARLIPLGIWQDVELRAVGNIRCSHVKVTTLLDEKNQSGEVSVHITPSLPSASQGKAEVRIWKDGKVIAWSSGDFSKDDSWSLVLSVPNPEIWWPNGFGSHPTYRLEVRLFQADGQLSDEHFTSFGFREIKLVPNHKAPTGAMPYTFVVNGQPIFIKGFNWVPVDNLYGPTRAERYQHLISLARQANCNLLRVWGGGLIERDLFYELCSQNGIMVWQEFIQSSSAQCSIPPDDEDYLTLLAQNATAALLAKRNFPCLAVWSGGNELYGDGYRPLTESHPTLALLGNLVRKYSPEIPFLPTSASGPYEFLDPTRIGEGIHHDVHGPWKYAGPKHHYSLYNASDSLFHSEFGVDGCAAVSSIQACLSKDALWPPTKHNMEWAHHGAAWWDQSIRNRQLFGEIRDLEQFVWASQWIQAEGLRYAVEANRRRKFMCSGNIIWQLNEPFPNATCTSCVDYYGVPKMGYYWVGKAYAPLHVSLKYDSLVLSPDEHISQEVWIHNAYPNPQRGEVRWRVVTLDGTVINAGACPVQAGPEVAQLVTSLDWQASLSSGTPVLVVLEWVDGDVVIAFNEYCFVVSNGKYPLESLVRIPSPILDLTLDQVNDTHWRLDVTNVGGITALFVNILSQPGKVKIEGPQYMSLFPNSNRQFDILLRQPLSNRDLLQLRCWGLGKEVSIEP